MYCTFAWLLVNCNLKCSPKSCITNFPLPPPELNLGKQTLQKGTWKHSPAPRSRGPFQCFAEIAEACSLFAVPQYSGTGRFISCTHSVCLRWPTRCSSVFFLFLPWWGLCTPEACNKFWELKNSVCPSLMLAPFRVQVSLCYTAFKFSLHWVLTSIDFFCIASRFLLLTLEKDNNILQRCYCSIILELPSDSQENGKDYSVQGGGNLQQNNVFLT